MWKQYIQPDGIPALRRATPAVYRYKNNTHLVLPKAMVDADRVDIFVSEDRRIGFHINPAGKFRVNTPKQGQTVRLTIPREYVASIPFGTTDVELSREGEMLVLDLTQLQKPANDMAAE